MGNSELITEERILNAAYHVFLSRGFHGTTLQQIANEANVNKSAIHYYFRSKERLYIRIVKRVMDTILDENNLENKNSMDNTKWFLLIELHNNTTLFKIALKELFLHEWEKELTKIENWLELTVGK